APHLTLARIKDPLSNQELTTLQRLIPPARDSHARHNKLSSTEDGGQNGIIPVEHLSVMKSELLRDGPRYTCLHRCPLSTG
ncbi:MAG TPA: hypothetical protein VF099_02600, partial [Ktedonobacterales bacterium]